MNILGVFSTHGAQALGGIKGVESTKAAQAAVQQGVGEVANLFLRLAQKVQSKPLGRAGANAR